MFETAVMFKENTNLDKLFDYIIQIEVLFYLFNKFNYIKFCEMCGK